MEAKEFAVFADRLKTAFPKDNLLATRDQMDWWFDLLGDIPFQTAILALKKYALSNKFPPSVSEIRTIAADLTGERLPDADEAWGQVNNAIRRYGYMREREALDSMSEPVRKAVERIGFQNICQSPYEQLNTLRAQFRGAYEAEYRRSMEVHKMPELMRLEQASVQQAALPMKEG
ncbi:replicative helicase loader/inhibitor [Lacrimispora sp.]|uniref:replicative helicase loader/inhibitor n=1 Tax=Lacrimispora sp. TaxID=2719234 RepID=UPI0028583598|nr:replicative helicase loader/inhibitor [Lacrimispora sp.]MDR7815145.1 replicative helicase loader/inhibitor [Lacrimispora sp.]